MLFIDVIYVIYKCVLIDGTDSLHQGVMERAGESEWLREQESDWESQ